MSLACLIVEDQAPAQRILARYIADLPHLELAGTCGSALEAMALLHERCIDLIFLDLNLPRLGGFDFLRSLAQPPKVIVTTAYPQHALDGFDLAVVDYLVKPIAFDRFMRAVDKVRGLASSEISDPHKQGQSPGKIFVKVDNELRPVALDDIVFLRAEGDYVTIVTHSTKLFVGGPLAHWERRLPAQRFIRTHKSYIVNLASIARIAGSTIITSAGGLPIGRRYREQLLQGLAF